MAYFCQLFEAKSGFLCSLRSAKKNISSCFKNRIQGLFVDDGLDMTVPPQEWL